MKHKTALFLFVMSFVLINCKNTKGIIGISVGNSPSHKVTLDKPYQIYDVVENSPAHRAGIKPGDIIIQVDSTPIVAGMRHDYIFYKLISGKAGTKVQFVIKREGTNRIFQIQRAYRE